MLKQSMFHVKDALLKFMLSVSVHFHNKQCFNGFSIRQIMIMMMMMMIMTR